MGASPSVARPDYLAVTRTKGQLVQEIISSELTPEQKAKRLVTEGLWELCYDSEKQIVRYMVLSDQSTTRSRKRQILRNLGMEVTDEEMARPEHESRAELKQRIRRSTVPITRKADMILQRDVWREFTQGEKEEFLAEVRENPHISEPRRKELLARLSVPSADAVPSAVERTDTPVSPAAPSPLEAHRQSTQLSTIEEPRPGSPPPAARETSASLVPPPVPLVSPSPLVGPSLGQAPLGYPPVYQPPGYPAPAPVQPLVVPSITAASVGASAPSPTRALHEDGPVPPLLVGLRAPESDERSRVAVLTREELCSHSPQSVYHYYCGQYGLRPKPIVHDLLSPMVRDFSLRELRIPEVAYVGDRGLLPILEVVNICLEMKFFSAVSNGIANHGVEAFTQMALQHPSLQGVDFSGNTRISNAGATVLNFLAQKNAMFLVIDLYNTGVDEALKQMIQAKLDYNDRLLCHGPTAPP